MTKLEPPMPPVDEPEESALEQRLAYHRHMHQHLQEVSLFVLFEAVESNLMPVEDARHLKKQMAEMTDLPHRRLRLPFEVTKGAGLQNFVNHLYAFNPAPVLIWTEFATICGPMRIGSITDVNFDFGFDANAAGIVSFTTIDGTDRLLLSWEEDDDGRQVLDIDVTGRHWVQAIAPAKANPPK